MDKTGQERCVIQTNTLVTFSCIIALVSRTNSRPCTQAHTYNSHNYPHTRRTTDSTKTDKRRNKTKTEMSQQRARTCRVFIHARVKWPSFGHLGVKGCVHSTRIAVTLNTEVIYTETSCEGCENTRTSHRTHIQHALSFWPWPMLFMQYHVFLALHFSSL